MGEVKPQTFPLGTEPRVSIFKESRLEIKQELDKIVGAEEVRTNTRELNNPRGMRQKTIY
jgi:hypothetical protein